MSRWNNRSRREGEGPDCCEARDPQTDCASEARAAFVFTGPGRLTLRGPRSGIEYRFTSGGPSVRVHPSDVAPLARFPGLEVLG